MVQCRHYWLLSPPQSDKVIGHCKRCDSERIFPARLDDTDRSNDYLDLAGGSASSRDLAGSWSERVAS